MQKWEGQASALQKVRVIRAPPPRLPVSDAYAVAQSFSGVYNIIVHEILRIIIEHLVSELYYFIILSAVNVSAG